MNAAADGEFELVKLLAKHNAKLNHRGKYRLTALMLAVVNHHQEIVSVLVEAGADTTLRGRAPFECSPLEYADDHQFDEIAQILTKQG